MTIGAIPGPVARLTRTGESGLMGVTDKAQLELLTGAALVSQVRKIKGS